MHNDGGVTELSPSARAHASMREPVAMCYFMHDLILMLVAARALAPLRDEAEKVQHSAAANTSCCDRTPVGGDNARSDLDAGVCRHQCLQLCPAKQSWPVA